MSAEEAILFEVISNEKDILDISIPLFGGSFKDQGRYYLPAYQGFGPSVSMEFIGSYELAFTRFNTLNFWGGAGMIFNPMTSPGPSLGTEMGIEIRHYFKERQFDKFNLSLYGGLGCMKNYKIMHYKIYKEDNTFGLVPGIKLTYKKRISPLFVMEPYISLSYPFYNDHLGYLFDTSQEEDQYLCLTLGFRIGLNKVKQKCN